MLTVARARNDSAVRNAARLDSADPRIIAAIDASDGIEYTRGRAEAESRAAVEALEAVPESAHRDALASLARIAVGRDR